MQNPKNEQESISPIVYISDLQKKEEKQHMTVALWLNAEVHIY